MLKLGYTPITHMPRGLEGSIATYIPQLACVEPDKFAVSVCTVTGQRFDIGDSEDMFSLQVWYGMV